MKVKPDKIDVNGLKHLSEEVLAQVVREAELFVEAQYKSHLASEQRGYTLSGLALAAATASVSSYFGENANHQDSLIGFSKAIFSTGMVLTALFSIVSVWPKKFSFPGNEPKNWAFIPFA